VGAAVSARIGVRGFLFNLASAALARMPRCIWPPGNRVVDAIDDWVIDGAERHTPRTHRWHDEPMF
jgi:hypothetical protein